MKVKRIKLSMVYDPVGDRKWYTVHVKYLWYWHWIKTFADYTSAYALYVRLIESKNTDCILTVMSEYPSHE